jgi:hypothetical protein
MGLTVLCGFLFEPGSMVSIKPLVQSVRQKDWYSHVLRYLICFIALVPRSLRWIPSPAQPGASRKYVRNGALAYLAGLMSGVLRADAACLDRPDGILRVYVATLTEKRKAASPR